MEETYHETVGEETLKRYLDNGEVYFAKGEDQAAEILMKWITNYSIKVLEYEGFVHVFGDNVVISEKGKKECEKLLKNKDETS